MKASQSLRVSTLRLLHAQLVNEEIAKKSPLADEDVLKVIQREAKKRREAALAYRTGGRADAASTEEAERIVLDAYLPPQFSDADIEKVVRMVIAAQPVHGAGAQGKVMGAVMAKVHGQADGTRVRAIVERVLSSL
jgi:hypothetical protein